MTSAGRSGRSVKNMRSDTMTLKDRISKIEKGKKQAHDNPDYGFAEADADVAGSRYNEQRKQDLAGQFNHRRKNRDRFQGHALQRHSQIEKHT